MNAILFGIGNSKKLETKKEKRQSRTVNTSKGQESKEKKVLQKGKTKKTNFFFLSTLQNLWEC
jgi:hypothetical protein